MPSWLCFWSSSFPHPVVDLQPGLPVRYAVAHPSAESLLHSAAAGKHGAGQVSGLGRGRWVVKLQRQPSANLCCLALRSWRSGVGGREGFACPGRIHRCAIAGQVERTIAEFVLGDQTCPLSPPSPRPSHRRFACTNASRPHGVMCRTMQGVQPSPRGAGPLGQVAGGNPPADERSSLRTGDLRHRPELRNSACAFAHGKNLTRFSGGLGTRYGRRRRSP